MTDFSPLGRKLTKIVRFKRFACATRALIPHRTNRPGPCISRPRLPRRYARVPTSSFSRLDRRTIGVSRFSNHSRVSFRTRGGCVRVAPRAPLRGVSPALVSTRASPARSSACSVFSGPFQDRQTRRAVIASVDLPLSPPFRGTARRRWERVLEDAAGLCVFGGCARAPPARGDASAPPRAGFARVGMSSTPPARVPAPSRRFPRADHPSARAAVLITSIRPLSARRSRNPGWRENVPFTLSDRS